MKKVLVVTLLASVTLVGSTSSAQQMPYLPELLTRFEEYNRLYADKRRAGGNLQAIEPLRQQGEAAFRDFNLPVLFQVIAQGTALLRGRVWDEKEKFLASLNVEVDRLVIEPNQDVLVSLVKLFPSSSEKAFNAPPTVTVDVRPDEAGAPAARPIVLADRLSIGEASTVANRRLRLADGLYWVVATIESGGARLAELKRPLYAVSDFTDRIARLSSEVSAIKNSTDPKVKAVASAVITPEFQLARLAALNRTRGEHELDVFAELDRIERVLARLAEGRNPLELERGEVERAYRAAEGKLVSYRLYVPTSYDGARARPLVVALHGATGDERSYFSGQYDPTVIKGEAERRTVIIAAPSGGGRFGAYRGSGLDDVFEVINAVTRDYKIDPRRIYLTGHSMGGMGTWLIAAARPDLFAAIAPVAGGPVAQGEALTSLLQKLKGIPALVLHGARDGIVTPDRSRAMVDAAKKAGLKVTYLEVADADHISIVAATFPAALEFFDKNPKQTASK